jgi:hypothetical protein
MRSRERVVYRVVAAGAVRDQLRGAPPQLQGYVAGIVAVLRVDPTAASAAFDAQCVDDACVAVFAGGRGFLTYWTLEDQQVVVLLDLTWL